MTIILRLHQIHNIREDFSFAIKYNILNIRSVKFTELICT